MYQQLYSEFLNRWVLERQFVLAETTFCEYKRMIEKSIGPYFSEMKIRIGEIKPHHIQTYYTFLLSRGLTANTIHRYHAILHRSLGDAERLEIIRSNPASKVTLPKIVKYRGSFYTKAELQILINIVKGTKLEVPVLLASWFGMRRGEIVGVRWSSIDINEKVLYMNGTITDKGDGSRTENLTYRNQAKTETSIRAFPLEDEHILYFTAIHERQCYNAALAGDCYNHEWDDFVCVDNMGNLLHPEYISRRFPQILKANELRKIRFHDLRHTNATLLLNEGATLKEVQDWMGHKSILTTGNTYGHVLLEAKRRLSGTMCGLVNA